MHLSNATLAKLALVATFAASVEAKYPMCGNEKFLTILRNENVYNDNGVPQGKFVTDEFDKIKNAFDVWTGDKDCITALNNGFLNSVPLTRRTGLINKIASSPHYRHVDLKGLSNYSYKEFLKAVARINGTGKDGKPTDWTFENKKFLGGKLRIELLGELGPDVRARISDGIISSIDPENFSAFKNPNLSKVKDLLKMTIQNKDGKDRPVMLAITPAQFEKFVSVPEHCEQLTPEFVTTTKRKELAQRITDPACLRRAPFVNMPITKEDKPIQNFISNIPPQAFSRLPKLIGKDVLTHLNANRVAAFDSAVAIEDVRCAAGVDLRDVAQKGAAGIDSRCMGGFVNYSGEQSINFTLASLKKFPTNIFDNVAVNQHSEINKFDTLSRVLTEANFQIMSNAETVKKLLSGVPETFATLTNVKWDNKNKGNLLPEGITGDQLLYAHDNVRAALLDKLIHKLDIKALSYIPKATDILTSDAIKNVNKKRDELLKYLGVDVPIGESHPCSLWSVGDLGNDKDVKALFPKTNAACHLSLGDTDTLVGAEEDLLKTLSPAVLATVGFERINKLAWKPTDFWSAMQPMTFEVLTYAPASCSALDAALLPTINAAAFEGMTAECLRQTKGELSKEQVSFLPVELFRNVDAEIMARFPNIAALKPAQLTALSAAITDAKLHAGHAFKVAMIASLSAEQVGALNALTLRYLDPAAWVGFTVDTFKAISPEAMAWVTYAQLKGLSADVLITITGAQAEQLGKNVKDPKDDPRQAFPKDVAARIIDLKAREILSGSSMVVASLAAIALSTIIGLWLA